METVAALCTDMDATSLLDGMRGTVQAACSIWWTPVRLQVNERGLVIPLSHSGVYESIET